MQRLGDALFARAGLAGDEHRGVTANERLELVDERVDRRRVPGQTEELGGRPAWRDQQPLDGKHAHAGLADEHRLAGREHRFDDLDPADLGAVAGAEVADA